MSKESDKAWQYLAEGNFSAAEQLSAQLINQNLVQVVDTPLLKVWFVKASIMLAKGLYAEAADQLTQIINLDASDRFSQDVLLSLLQENTAVDEDVEGQLVLGIGTGRSGSTSLAHLLSAQSNTYCSHEFPPILPWRTDGDERAFHFHVDKFKWLMRKKPFVCDSAHWWLPRIETLIESGIRLKVVAIKRDQEATVRSFLNLKGGGDVGSINHWVEHDDSFWNKNFWDVCYPKYVSDSLEDALNQYWAAYYDEVARLEALYPDVVNMFPIESLSSEAGQLEILSFCGFAKPVLLADAHKNANTLDDGRTFFQNPISFLSV